MNQTQSRKLKFLGMVLFLLGLITGLILMNFQNPRMGLSAHLEGIMNGTFLVVAGLIWDDLNISIFLKKTTCNFLIYGTFVNWLMTLLSACFGTSNMTPLAGQGFSDTTLHENIVTIGLITVGLTMISSLIVLIYGLRGTVAVHK